MSLNKLKRHKLYLALSFKVHTLYIKPKKSNLVLTKSYEIDNSQEKKYTKQHYNNLFIFKKSTVIVEYSHIIGVILEEKQNPRFNKEFGQYKTIGAMTCSLGGVWWQCVEVDVLSAWLCKCTQDKQTEAQCRSQSSGEG